MHHEASQLTPTVPKNTGTEPGSPATKQTIVRSTDNDHARWKQAAERLNISLAEYIRGCCNDKAAELLDCSHPVEFRRWYPWAETCLKCGTRLGKPARPAPKRLGL